LAWEIVSSQNSISGKNFSTPALMGIPFENSVFYVFTDLGFKIRGRPPARV